MKRHRSRAPVRVPPFADSPSANPPGGDEAGARILAAQIKAAWKRVGHDVDAMVHYAPSAELEGGGRSKAVWEIRSSLVGGLPR